MPSSSPDWIAQLVNGSWLRSKTLASWSAVRAAAISDARRSHRSHRRKRAYDLFAAHGVVRQDRADDVDFLAAVDLIPERLQDFSDRRGVGVLAVHQLRHVLEADVAVQQLLMVQGADAAMALDRVPLEREVHLFDAELLGARAERGLGAFHAATEQNAIVCVHSSNFSLLSSNF